MGNQYNRKDIAGKKFNMLTAIKLVERRPIERKSGREDIEYYWEFLCDCGNKTITRRDRVVTGKKPIISCGCMRNRSKWKGCGNLSKTQWGIIERNAKKRELCFEITMKDAWNLFQEQGEKCALSGQKINFKEPTASLDRIDSSKGYTIDNVQWVHKDINISKWDFTMDKFLEICRMVTEYNR